MEFNLMFFVNSALLGAGLAMDAFSVSVANGLSEPSMKTRKMIGVAGVYSFFQFLMPMVGWICVHTLVQAFHAFEAFIPYIALLLLLYIGIKMIVESVREKEQVQQNGKSLTLGVLLMQGIATSIDALSVGFTIEKYSFPMALIAALIIAAVTYIICHIGLVLGKRVGNKFTKAEIIGGMILIGIGVEIFVKGVLKI